MDKKDNNRFTSSVSANLAILEKLQGLWMARAIHVAVRLGLPDLLGKGAKPLSELSSATRCPEPALHRLLRCLKHLGIVKEVLPDFYSGTPLCEQLQHNRSDSLYWLSSELNERHARYRSRVFANTLAQASSVKVGVRGGLYSGAPANAKEPDRIGPGREVGIHVGRKAKWRAGE